MVGRKRLHVGAPDMPDDEPHPPHIQLSILQVLEGYALARLCNVMQDIVRKPEQLDST